MRGFSLATVFLVFGCGCATPLTIEQELRLYVAEPCYDGVMARRGAEFFLEDAGSTVDQLTLIHVASYGERAGNLRSMDRLTRDSDRLNWYQELTARCILELMEGT